MEIGSYLSKKLHTRKKSQSDLPGPKRHKDTGREIEASSNIQLIQAYGSLVLENNSEVGEAVLASAPVPSSQLKKQTHSLQRGLPGEDLVISPTCKLGPAGLVHGRTNYAKVRSGSGIPLHVHT